MVTSDVLVGRPPDATAGEPPVPFELPLPPPGPGVATRGAVAGGGPQTAVVTRAFGPVAMGAFGFPGAQTTSEDLGEQVLEGVLTHGTRETQTIPAGAIGNERAIDIVAEQWYSNEIEAVVLRRNVDPRFGETTYRLANLVRSEPAPDLFTVPQGYELQSEPALRRHKSSCGRSSRASSKARTWGRPRSDPRVDASSGEYSSCSPTPRPHRSRRSAALAGLDRLHDLVEDEHLARRVAGRDVREVRLDRRERDLVPRIQHAVLPAQLVVRTAFGDRKLETGIALNEGGAALVDDCALAFEQHAVLERRRARVACEHVLGRGRRAQP